MLFVSSQPLATKWALVRTLVAQNSVMRPSRREGALMLPPGGMSVCLQGRPGGARVAPRLGTKVLSGLFDGHG